MINTQQKKGWLNLGLIVVVIALAGVAWLSQQAPDKQGITPMSADQVTRVRIGGAGLSDLEFIQQGESWNIIQPDWQMPASEFRIRDVSKLSELPYTASYDASEVTLSDLHLEQGLVHVTLNDTEIIFGDLNPINQRRYLRIGERVYLTADDYFHVLRTEAASWLGANLIPSGDIISKIAYDQHFTVLLENGTWSSNDPEISTQNIEQLVNHWQSAQAVWAKQSQAAESLGEITIHVQNKKPIVFQILEIEPDLKLGRPDLGVTYTLNADEISQLLEIQTVEPASSALE